MQLATWVMLTVACSPGDPSLKLVVLLLDGTPQLLAKDPSVEEIATL